MCQKRIENRAERKTNGGIEDAEAAIQRPSASLGILPPPLLSGEILEPRQRVADLDGPEPQERQRDQVAQVAECSRVSKTLHERPAPLTEVDPVLGMTRDRGSIAMW